MSPSERPLVTLRVEPATALTEVTVSDSQFRKVSLPTNSGIFEIPLPAGIYEVGFRDGRSIHRELVILAPDQDGPVVARQPASPIDPAWAADVDDEESLQTAMRLRLIVHDRRDGAPMTNDHLRGLSLADASGTALPGGKVDKRDDSTRQTFEVEAGLYRLRLETGLGDQVLETPLVVPPGWSLFASCFLREYKKDDYRADLTTLRIRLRAADRSFRGSRTESALESRALSLIADQRTLSGEGFDSVLQDCLQRNYINPMFGLYAGHLLRGINEDERATLAELVANLEKLTTTGPNGQSVPPPGFIHPDVEALKLRLQLLKGQPIVDPPALPLPPMLAASWQTIVQVAAHSTKVIPKGSLADLVSCSLTSAGASVIWNRQLAQSKTGEAELAAFSAFSMPPSVHPVSGADLFNLAPPGPASSVAPATRSAAQRSPSDAIEVIAAAMRDSRLREWVRANAGAAAGGAGLIGNAGAMVIQAVYPLAPDEKFQRLLAVRQVAQAEDDTPRDAAAVAGRLGLPLATVERAAEEVAGLLLDQAQVLGINLPARAIMARPELIIPYDPGFLGDGFVVSVPALSDALRASAFADGAVIDYTHFSLIMHANRRVAIVAAHNVDASRAVRIKGGLTWKMDERAGECQLGPGTYANNQLDRGHLVRREDVLWGTVPEAKLANKATFFYTNAAPQHKNFNQDEWVTLEDWVLDKATDFSYRLCVFTGPVLRDNDPVLTDLPPNLRAAFPAGGPAQIPAAFWKVVVLRDTDAGGDDLSVVCFAMRQSDMWNDREGRRLLKLKVHQVTLSAIEGWTGLDFGDLKNADELAWSEERTRAVAEAEPLEWPQVRSASDIVYSGTVRRLRGLRAARSTAAATRSVSRSAVAAREAGDIRAAADCGCDNTDFDARTAVAELSREVARLTEVVAAQARSQQAAPPFAAPATRAAVAAGAGALRSMDVAAPAASDDARVQRMVDAAPAHQKDAMLAFARTVVMQHDVARGVVALPPVTELERIVGGNSVQSGAVPSCVCIGDATRWFCTGVVVAPRVVLTAAHCTSQITRILIGDTVQSGRIVPVQKVVVHPQYKGHPFNENDINVLILSQPAGVPPARLAAAAELAVAPETHLVGFGFNDPAATKGFGVKREVRVPIGAVKRSPTDDLSMFEALTGFHPDYEFVAGRKALGKDSCNGDSGGPAYIDTAAGPVVAGLTSRATRDADVACGAGGIYVRTDSFRSWIGGILSSSGLGGLPT